jgi:hypothetical protein
MTGAPLPEADLKAFQVIEDRFNEAMVSNNVALIAASPSAPTNGSPMSTVLRRAAGAAC